MKTLTTTFVVFMNFVFGISDLRGIFGKIITIFTDQQESLESVNCSILSWTITLTWTVFHIGERFTDVDVKAA